MASAEITGERVGRYSLLFRVAQGGMGEVFVGALRGAGDFTNVVVLKRLLPQYAEDPRYVAALRTEARLAAQVRHPNVCQIFELVEEPTVGLALVMEYLEGVPLRRLADASSDLAIAGGLAAQACAGLARIHDLADRAGKPMGLVHRDVNPSNLFVTIDGTLKVLDFGIAKADGITPKTRGGAIKGTSDFLAPEQILGQVVDRRADVFALGATLFELVTGASPFRRESEYLTFRAITEEPPPRARKHRPDLPQNVDEVLLRALARDPADRWPNADALGEAFVTALGVAPATNARVGSEVEARFHLELEERRRRIHRGLEALEHGAVEAPTTAPLSETREPPPTSATVSERRMAPAEPPRRTRGVAIAVIAIAAIGAGALAWKRPWRVEPAAAGDVIDATAAPTSDARPATPDARVPSDAATTPDGTPPDAAPPDAAAPDAAATVRKKPHTREPGFVTIASRPFATIYIDGKKLGPTPIYRQALAPGRHRVKAVCSCKKTKTFWISVAPGVAAPPRNLTW